MLGISDSRWRLHVVEMEGKYGLDDTGTTTTKDVANLLLFSGTARLIDLTKRQCFYEVKPDAAREIAVHKKADDLHSRAITAELKSLHNENVDPRMLHGIVGIASESGELIDEALEALIANKPIDMDNLHDELGDLLFYVELLMYSAGKQGSDNVFSYDGVRAANIAKLQTRYKSNSTKVGDAHDYAAERKAQQATMGK